MSDHVLIWEYDRDSVVVRPRCDADPATADCHINWICGCEEISGFGRDEHGPFHRFEVFGGEVKHYGNQGAENCNVVDFMENDDALMESGPNSRFLIGETPIEPIWSTDYYEWRPAS